MTSFEAEFEGGPADGVLRAFPGEPPSTLALQVSTGQRTPLGGMFTWTARYRRTVSPADDGPLWRYVYVSGD